MISRPESDEALIRRIMPVSNSDRQDRARAWAEWQAGAGRTALARFVRAHNSTLEPDDDIIQETLLTAYLGVERGHYQPREGVSFTAYVVGIARNKIREAWRRERYRAYLNEDQELEPRLEGELHRQPERFIERREQHELLRSGLSRLSKPRREVIERYLTGESTNEIADRLSMSEALVRQHKCRGLRSLQREFQQSDALGQAA